VNRTPAHGVETFDATDAAFRERLCQFLAPATRAELYLAAGSVPELVWIADISPAELRRVVTDNLALNFTAVHAFTTCANALAVPAAIIFLGSVGASRPPSSTYRTGA
jgi:hypothetical protein